MNLSTTITKVFILIITIILAQQIPFAQDGTFEIKVFPSLMDSRMDGWYKIPPNTGPQIHKVSTVYKDQEFRVIIFFRNYAVDTNSNVNLQYDLQLLDPNGNPTETKANELIGYQGKVSTPKNLLLNQQFTSIGFSDEDEYGTYTVKVTSYDKVAKTSFISEEKVELLPFQLPTPFSSEKEAGNWIMQYYKTIKPIEAVSGVQHLIRTNPDWLKKNPNLVTFFQTIFTTNTFLFKHIATMFEIFSPEDQKKFILLAALSKNKSFDFHMSKIKELKEYHDLILSTKIPTLSDKITSPYQLDILWSEFLATGRYEPITRIVGSLAYAKHEGLLEKIKTMDPASVSKEMKDQLELEMTYRSAMWSLISNCTRIPLAFKYCEYIYANEKIDDTVKEQLYLVLGMAQKQIQESKKQ